MIPRRLLRRFSVEDLRAAIRQKGNLDKVTALERKREKLQKALSRIDRKLARLNGVNGSPRKPAKAKGPGKRGRRRGFKVSAATRRKMRLAALRRHSGQRQG